MKKACFAKTSHLAFGHGLDIPECPYDFHTQMTLILLIKGEADGTNICG